MGLFEAIFGKGAPKDDTAPKEAFYLSDDDAKTMGDIEYMRSNKTVRRTFAKKKGAEHMESVRQISSSKSVNVDDTSTEETSNENKESSVSAPKPKTVPTGNRRRFSSDGMDSFRDMAKKIGK